MRVRVKTLEELKEDGATISEYRIANGRYFMTSEMMKYCGREVELVMIEPGLFRKRSTNCLVWETWMFEEIKEMNRNGANEGVNDES